jgi:hypothetical protein
LIRKRNVEIVTPEGEMEIAIYLYLALSRSVHHRMVVQWLD